MKEINELSEVIEADENVTDSLRAMDAVSPQELIRAASRAR